ncbi:MAG: hypothetical protein KJO31_04050 [Gammaproteobacteria bacterium]|nr:hypothetical protein [Gammaproteobacteria bacterium]
MRGIVGGFAIVLLLVPLFVGAQDDNDQNVYVYATYFVCDPATETRADEIIARSYAPHYNAAVEQGNLSSWSWLAHFIGGKWRRVLVLTAPNMEELLESSGALGEIIGDTTPEAGRVFTEVCNAHVDYIWTTNPAVDGSRLSVAEPGVASFSTYLQCDISSEDRADEIMAKTIGPVYQKYVDSGRLGSWGWLRHSVGEEFRRLLTLTADDHATLMAVRDSIVAELRSGRNQRAFKQFNEICNVHHDYMWDIQIGSTQT